MWLLDLRRHAFGRLHAVVVAEELDGQDLCERSGLVARLALEAREGHVAADHQQTVPLLYMLGEHAQAVGGTLAALGARRVELDGVGRDVAQDHHVEGLEVCKRPWEVLNRIVIRDVRDLVTVGSETVDQLG